MSRAKITGAQVLAIRGQDTQTEFAALVGASSGGIVSGWEREDKSPSPVFARKLRALARERGVDLGNGQVASA